MSDVLADWFDTGIWKQTGHGEYREPVDPRILLDPSPECIWPGLMGCDLIPLISNTAGDWLCLRINDQGDASQIVQWYHGGGDWIPWGNSVAEAIVFDALIDRLPGASRRHATPAENPRPHPEERAATEDSMLAWAAQHVPADVARLLRSRTDEYEVAETLLGAGVSEVAVRCELVLTELMHRSRAAVEILRQSGHAADRRVASQWTFDVDRIPDQARGLLDQRGVTLDDAQNWQAAEQHCQRVTQLAPELAWAWDILGYAAERNGDAQAATDNYLRACHCSVFTDQSIRLETYWSTDMAAKFAAARLAQLAPQAVKESAYLKLLVSPEIHLRRPRVMSFWLEQAAECLDSGDPCQAHRCYVAAGWDVGAEPITAFANLLERVAETAVACGQPSRGEVARTHRQCLKDRYNL